ncbi:MAG: cytochrome P450 [Chloroflexota bacterium]
MSTYPKTNILDMFGLLGRMGKGVLLRQDRSEVLADWVQNVSKRLNSNSIYLNLYVTKILLANGDDLSAHILAKYPSHEGYIEGTLKRKAMSFLAPNALTISDDEQWTELRRYNEKVLHTGTSHPSQQAFLNQLHHIFAYVFDGPPKDIDEIRVMMGKLMLSVVFGTGKAPDHLRKDIYTLFNELGIRTALIGSRKTKQRDRFRKEVQDLWAKPQGGNQPSLVAIAKTAKSGLSPTYQVDGYLVDQIPHWMFTFTNSGTELLCRALALISARPKVRQRVLDEIAQVGGDLQDAETINQLVYLEACLMEAGRLYPPVTRTAHSAAVRDEFEQKEIRENTSTIHLFQMNNRDIIQDPQANDFVPERWLDNSPQQSMETLYPNIFLSGARACPGRGLILFVNKAAIALCLTRYYMETCANELKDDPVPYSFPKHGEQFCFDSE